MTDNKTVMQQALEALEVSHQVLRNNLVIEDAIVALRAAIAQPVPLTSVWREHAIFLIHYDDQDRRPEIWTGEAAGRARFKTVSTSWNAHLFVKIASNSRDDSYADNNAPMFDDTVAQPVQQPSTIEPVAYIDPDTQLTITATLKSLNSPKHARYSIALSHIEFEALKATSSYCIQPAPSMSMFADKTSYEEAMRAQSVDLPDEQVALIKDAKRWRRLVNASEMEFPVLTIAEDPENDCILKYGRQTLERLVDICDEISDASDASE